MVEEAVVLVEGEEQRRLGPDVGVAGQRVQHLRDVPGAVVGRPVRVLGVGLRGHDPRHLGQLVGLYVGCELVEERPARLPRRCRCGRGRTAGRRARRPGTAGSRAASCRRSCRCRARRCSSPSRARRRARHPCPGRPSRSRPPACRRSGYVVQPTAGDVRLSTTGPPRCPSLPDPAAPQVVPVGVRRTQHAAVVGVADGEGVGQRVVERDVRRGAGAPSWSARPWPGPSGRSARR